MAKFLSIFRRFRRCHRQAKNAAIHKWISPKTFDPNLGFSPAAIKSIVSDDKLCSFIEKLFIF